ncbi:anti-sigma-I factor RsgI family protein [Robinsoniella peoriensis]|uniref:anti-sigma-I factor RsgI family protein n=1 Tax=Robinsoniella peoriensis TaxID=180332 RepID=UPI003626DA02
MQKIEQGLKQAVEDITPDVFNKVAASEDEKLQKEEWLLDEPKSWHKIHLAFRGAAALAACLILILGIRIFWNNQIDSTIDIDVNPSVEIQTNRKNLVKEVKALNKDGEIIIADMNLKNVELNTAVNALIGSMVRKGYITEVNNSILVSVENKDTKKADEICQSIVGDIRQVLDKKNIKGVIYNQEITSSEEISGLAQQYEISQGKAAFLLKLIKKDPELKMEQLAKMTMQEIAQLIRIRSIDISDMAGYESDESILENVEDIIEESSDSRSTGNKQKVQKRGSDQSDGGYRDNDSDDEDDIDDRDDEDDLYNDPDDLNDDADDFDQDLEDLNDDADELDNDAEDLNSDDENWDDEDLDERSDDLDDDDEPDNDD